MYVYTQYITGVYRRLRHDFNTASDFWRIIYYVIMVVAITFVATLLVNVNQEKEYAKNLDIAELKPGMRVDALHDYYDFPCIRHLPRSLELRLHGHCVRFLQKAHITPRISLHERCQYIPIRSKPSICTYKPMRENESIFYHYEGTREKPNIEIMVDMLKDDPKLIFFDIGTNEGSYCIAASRQSKKTVCMNGNYKILKLLWNSLVINVEPDNAFFIWNVLADKPKTINYRFYETPPQYASVSRDKELNDFVDTYKPTEFEYKVGGVTLNDLTYVIQHGRPVFMKIDMDGVDIAALNGGDTFFSINDVRVIQIVTSHQDTWVQIARMLAIHRFKPFALRNGNIAQRRLLKKGDVWPRNVYFFR